MSIAESLVTGTREVDKIYEAANLGGFDVIKLIWRRKGESNANITGFDIPTVRSMKNSNPLSDDEIEVPLYFGEVVFYPDENGYRWGYVIATPKNLKRMAAHLSSPWYKIQDTNYRNQVISIAEEFGFALEPGVQESAHVVIGKDTKEAKDTVKLLEKEARQAKATLLKMQKDLAKANEELAIAKLSNSDLVVPTAGDDVSLDDDGIPITKEKGKKKNN